MEEDAMTAEIKIRELARSPYYGCAKIAAACILGAIALLTLHVIMKLF